MKRWAILLALLLGSQIWAQIQVRAGLAPFRGQPLD